MILIDALSNQYPPMFTVTKNSDGTYSYSGASHEAVQYISKALNIRYIIYELGYNYLITSLDILINIYIL